MTEEPTRLNALGVDPASDSRMRLKQAMGAVVLFKEVLLYTSVNEAGGKLTNSVIPFDVIFISERIARDEALAFIRESKQKPVSQDAAFILLVASDPKDQQRAARSVLEGFDGMLPEPYSIDALVDVTRLARVVNKKRAQERQIEAITFIVRDVIKRLDRLAYIKQCQANPAHTLANFRKACKVFHTFDPEVLAHYYEVAGELFAEAGPYASLAAFVGYKGASERIKKKMIEKILALEE